MKKGILAAGVVLLLTLAIPPQAAAKVDFGLGIKGGVCRLNVKSDFPSWPEKSGLTPTFGIFAVFNLGPTFVLQPELDYVRMGYIWWDYYLSVGKFVETYNTLQVPVLFKARLVRGGKIIPVVSAGPVLGILLSARVKHYDMDGVLAHEGDIKDLYRSVDLGAAFGAGVEILSGKLAFIVDVRYYLGLMDTDVSPDFAAKNAGLMVTGGIEF
jgi:hypothetical protein